MVSPFQGSEKSSEEDDVHKNINELVRRMSEEFSDMDIGGSDECKNGKEQSVEGKPLEDIGQRSGMRSPKKRLMERVLGTPGTDDESNTLDEHFGDKIDETSTGIPVTKAGLKDGTDLSGYGSNRSALERLKDYGNKVGPSGDERKSEVEEDVGDIRNESIEKENSDDQKDGKDGESLKEDSVSDRDEVNEQDDGVDENQEDDNGQDGTSEDGVENGSDENGQGNGEERQGEDSDGDDNVQKDDGGYGNGGHGNGGNGGHGNGGNGNGKDGDRQDDQKDDEDKKDGEGRRTNVDWTSLGNLDTLHERWCCSGAQCDALLESFRQVNLDQMPNVKEKMTIHRIRNSMHIYKVYDSKGLEFWRMPVRLRGTYEILFVELPSVISNPLAVFRDEPRFIPYFPESELEDYMIQRTHSNLELLAVTSRKRNIRDWKQYGFDPPGNVH